MELCLLSQDIIEKIVLVDVASPLEVNHVKSVCCATILVIVFYLFAICYLLHECCLSVDECMYVMLQFIAHRRLTAS